MTPTIYCADHQHAKVVCGAFAEGCGGKLVPATSALREGPAAMWGILRGSGDRIKDCELYGHPYFYIDHGYFARGHYDGHYRVVFCDRHLQGPPPPSDGGRWEALGLEITPMQLGRAEVVYLPVSRHVAAFLGFDAGKFDAEKIGRLARRTSAPIRSCAKDDEALTGVLPTTHTVVGFQSNALLEASLAGIHVEELGKSPAWWLNHRSREQVFHWLADNQWTLAEMRSGKCWSDLMERHGGQL